ncbi:MAG: CotH kinase family protein, partial [Myxococcales bacterium]|nr:CotH kinase family protein [Myxococcales bacterium]
MLPYLTETLLALVLAAPPAPLPTLSLDSRGVALNADDKVLCDLDIVGGGTDYHGYAGVKWRGSSSIGYAKKSYTVEIWDAAGDDLEPDQPLLGMPIEEDWVFYGPYHDQTGLRNWFSYTLARSLGRWAPRGEFATLTLNGEAQGLYVLFEKIKRDRHRVDVAKSDDAHPDRGYVFKLDKRDPDEPFVKPYLDEFVVVYPKEPNAAQSAFLEAALNELFVSLEAGGDPELGWPAHMDATSFHDEWIMQQLSANKDAFHTSSYFSKDAGGRIVAGPIWDINLGYGDGPLSDSGVTGWDPYTKPWWATLMADPAFVSGLI